MEVDNQDNAMSIHGGCTPSLYLSTQPAQSAKQAFNIVAAKLNNPKMNSDGKLVIIEQGYNKMREYFEILGICVSGMKSTCLNQLIPIQVLRKRQAMEEKCLNY
jgi:hypothetical protein